MKNSIIQNYNKLLYNSGPVKYSDFISDKYNKIHRQLYNNALDKLIESLVNQANTWINLSDDEKIKEKKPIFLYTTKKEFFEKTKIIEIKNDEYWKPSIVLIITKYKKSLLKIKYSLANYWNYYIYNNKNINYIENIKITKNKIYDAKIENINYVQGNVKLESIKEDLEFETDFNNLNEETEISDDYLLNNTFTQKYKNIK